MALLAGCASRPVVEEPTITSVPAALIADSGASLYVLEGPDNWLDELDVASQFPVTGWGISSPLNGKDDSADTFAGKGWSRNTWFANEITLGLMLRYALSQKQVFLIGHADFQPTSGFPMEVTLFNPDAEAHGRGPDRRRVGFRIRLKASTKVDSKSVDLGWESEQVTDGPESSEREGRPGQFPRVAEKIAAGSGMIPLGASLVMRQPKGDGRAYFILLRIASLK